MFDKPSLATRIAVGKAVGALFGVMAFFLLPVFGETDLLFRIGMLLYLATIGAFVGLFGVLTSYPVINIPAPWWFRGSLIGGFMMFILWLIAYERFDAIGINIMGEKSLFSSGAWIIADGLFIGLVIGAVATWLGGEGKETINA